MTLIGAFEDQYIYILEISESDTWLLNCSLKNSNDNFDQFKTFTIQLCFKIKKIMMVEPDFFMNGSFHKGIYCVLFVS